MKIQGRKVVAFFTTWLTLVITGLGTIFFAPEQWPGYVKWFIIGLLFNMVAFISFTVVKDYIKSKHFKPELFDGEK